MSGCLFVRADNLSKPENNRQGRFKGYLHGMEAGELNISMDIKLKLENDSDKSLDILAEDFSVIFYY